MSDDRKPAKRTERTLERDAERRKRLAEALRDNLRRRKAPRPRDDAPKD